jgi:hypothetical protein
MGWLRVFPSTIGALWSTVRRYSVAWKRYRRPLIAVQGPISSYHASATARAEAPKVGRTPASQYSTLEQATKWDLQNWVNSPIPLRFCQIRCRFTYLCVKQPEARVARQPVELGDQQHGAAGAAGGQRRSELRPVSTLAAFQLPELSDQIAAGL